MDKFRILLFLIKRSIATAKKSISVSLPSNQFLAKNKQDDTIRGFEVCGFTSTDPEWVRNDSFYKEIIARVVYYCHSIVLQIIKKYLKVFLISFVKNSYFVIFGKLIFRNGGD